MSSKLDIAVLIETNWRLYSSILTASSFRAGQELIFIYSLQVWGGFSNLMLGCSTET